jgi:hypothetical protein
MPPSPSKAHLTLIFTAQIYAIHSKNHPLTKENNVRLATDDQHFSDLWKKNLPLTKRKPH